MDWMLFDLKLLKKRIKKNSKHKIIDWLDWLEEFDGRIWDKKLQAEIEIVQQRLMWDGILAAACDYGQEDKLSLNITRPYRYVINPLNDYAWSGDLGKWGTEDECTITEHINFLTQLQLKKNTHQFRLRRDWISFYVKPTTAEIKAQLALYDKLSEKEWRKYLTFGFISIHSPATNYNYQIFRKSHFQVIARHGNKMSHLCIHTDSSCPPTDHVLNIKFLIENDESSLWEKSNVSTIEKDLWQEIEEKLASIIYKTNLRIPINQHYSMFHHVLDKLLTKI